MSVETYLYKPVKKADEPEYVDEQHIIMVIHNMQKSSSLMTSRLHTVSCTISTIVGYMAARWRQFIDRNGGGGNCSLLQYKVLIYDVTNVKFVELFGAEEHALKRYSHANETNETQLLAHMTSSKG